MSKEAFDNPRYSTTQMPTERAMDHQEELKLASSISSLSVAEVPYPLAPLMTFLDLPDDPIGRVIGNCSPTEQGRLALVNKRLRHLTSSHHESQAQIAVMDPRYKILRLIYPFDGGLGVGLWSSKQAHLAFLDGRYLLLNDFRYKWSLQLLDSIPPTQSADSSFAKLQALNKACPNAQLWMDLGVLLIQALSWPRDPDNLLKNLQSASAISLLVIRFLILYHEEVQMRKSESDREHGMRASFIREKHVYWRRVMITTLEAWCLTRGWIIPSDDFQRNNLRGVWQAVYQSAHYQRVDTGIFADPLASVLGPRTSRLRALQTGTQPSSEGAHQPRASVTESRKVPRRYSFDSRLGQISSLINTKLGERFGEAAVALTALDAYNLLEGVAAHRWDVIATIATYDARCWSREKLSTLHSIGLKSTFDVVNRDARAFEGCTEGLYKTWHQFVLAAIEELE